MNNCIKLFAPVILSIFLTSLFAGPGWGDEKILYRPDSISPETTSVSASEKILPDIYTVTKAERKKEFEIKARFLKVTGIDRNTSKNIVQPISDIKQVNLVLPEGFTLKTVDNLSDNIFTYKIVAPKIAGDYQIKFTIPSESWEYSYKMKIVTGYLKGLCSIIGFGLAGTLVASDRDLSMNGWGGGSNFLWVLGGAWVGGLIGTWIGDKLDENYYVYDPIESLFGGL